MDGRLEAGAPAMAGGTRAASFLPDMQDPIQWARVPAWMTQDPLIAALMGGPSSGVGMPMANPMMWDASNLPVGTAE